MMLGRFQLFLILRVFLACRVFLQRILVVVWTEKPRQVVTLQRQGFGCGAYSCRNSTAPAEKSLPLLDVFTNYGIIGRKSNTTSDYLDDK